MVLAGGVWDHPEAEPSAPILQDLEPDEGLRAVIEAALAASGPRKSSAILAFFSAACLLVAALAAAAVADSIGLGLAVVSAESVFVLLGARGRFRTRMVPDLAAEIPRVATAVSLGAAPPFLILSLLDDSQPNFRAFSGLVLVLFAGALVADWCGSQLTSTLWRRGHLRSRAILVGSGALAEELLIELDLRADYGVDVVGRFGGSEQHCLIDAVGEVGADRLIVAPFDDEHGPEAGQLVNQIRDAVGLGVPVFVVPRMYELGLGLDSMSPDRARGFPLVRLQRSAHPTLGLLLKRALDLLVAFVGLLCLSPILVLAAAAVRFTGPGPVLFRQPRVGRHGKVFDILKFRSMTVGPNEHSERFSAHRVTSVGRVLRATSVDELPQLWNVLRGEMSLVGPRPERISFVEAGLRLYPAYAYRHRMPMGITGLAQIAGLRGEETSVEERIKYDNLYIDQWSFAFDLQILAKTFFAIAFQRFRVARQRELESALTSMDSSSADRAGPPEAVDRA